jgi:hypothetical protein
MVRLKFLLRSALLLILFALYAYLRIDNLSYAAEKPRSLRDTQAYLRISREPLFSTDFLAGARPFGFPFVLKLFGGDQRSVVWAQGILSILSWGALAFFASRMIRAQVFAPLVFGGMLVFSLHQKIIGWDATLLTESLSLSWMALFLAGWLWLAKGWRWYKVFTLVCVSVFWAFTRDTNAWLLLMTAAVILLLVLMKHLNKLHLLPAGIFIAIFLLSNFSAEVGQRWVFPFNNVMAGRILVDDAAVSFFSACGMPVNETLMQLAGGFAGSDERAFTLAPELDGYRAWLKKDGKACYMKWLLSDPVRSLSQPLSEAETLLSLEQVGSFFFSRNFSPILPAKFEAVLLPSQWTLGILLLTNLVALSSLFSAAPKTNRAWLVAFGIIILVVPHYFLVWHGDVIGIFRHVLSAAVQLYLGMWLSLILIFDAMIKSPVADALKRLSSLLMA